MSRYGLSDREAREPAYVHESLASSDRRSEWHAQVEAWADRLDAARDDADKLDELCADIDEKVGQGEAWTAVCDLANGVLVRNKRLDLARAAILSIPMPEENDE